MRRSLLAACLVLTTGCAFVLKGQRVPKHVLTAKAADFEVPADVAVLHYYGSGGWGVQWRGNYLLLAPYFSNHDLSRFADIFHGREIVPNTDAVRTGFAGTPVAKTKAVVVGHGHIDHAGDVPAFFGQGLMSNATQPVLIADRSTTNLLAPLGEKSGFFDCVEAIDYDKLEDFGKRCATPGFHITPIHHAHAPHLNVGGVELAVYGGFVTRPQATLPRYAEDYKLGNTWAYLIDLLDESGHVAFRIHYVDAAASPPHGVQSPLPADGRDVDVHIGCVPGYELSEGYPQGILTHHNVRYVFAAHWEDFFQPRTDELKPVRDVLDAKKVERFIDLVEKELPQPRGVAPLNKGADDCKPPNQCGPHGTTWTLPVPGETFQFRAGPQASAPRLEDTWRAE
jgi:hypothetical protein